MRELIVSPNIAIYGNLELRATQLESFVLDPYRPQQDETIRQETMSIWDVMHSYIQHLMMGNDYINHHKAMLSAITDREIILEDYRDLALNNLPEFSVIEQTMKIKMVSKHYETFLSWTIDALWKDMWWWIDLCNIYDLKFSGKKWAPKRVETSKQKIYYTAMLSLMHDNRDEKNFTYCIFTTKEKKPRLFMERFTLDPHECVSILLSDFSSRIYEKEWWKIFDEGASWFI